MWNSLKKKALKIELILALVLLMRIVIEYISGYFSALRCLWIQVNVVVVVVVNVASLDPITEAESHLDLSRLIADQCKQRDESMAISNRVVKF